MNRTKPHDRLRPNRRLVFDLEQRMQGRRIPADLATTHDAWCDWLHAYERGDVSEAQLQDQLDRAARKESA